MLVLFDIDGTLLRTEGAGMRGMLAAAHELFPQHRFSFDGISISGRLDRLIWKDLMAHAGIEPTAERHESFRTAYGIHLQRGFADDARSHALAGARELVVALSRSEACVLGLLTGNYEHTGRIKVAHAAIPLEPFVYNAWADDGHHRRDLPPVAMQRHHAATGRSIDPSHVIIVGDTPLDIDCAHFNGCQAIAVATGAHPMSELASHNPELLVDGLDDWQALALWIEERSEKRS
ncbi:MAG: HAD family hydrolase [Phycisphaerales bacterium]|nr:HAD family hydrolase [Phycisphaerales bacterium]